MNKKTAKLDKVGIRRFFKMASEYKDVLSLTIGEPDFLTPQHIRDAASEALLQGKTKYAPVEGFMELKHEISYFLKRRYKLEYDPHQEILVTVGASEAIDLVFRTYVEPEDEIIIFEPCFVSYKPLAQCTGARVVVASCTLKDDYKVTPELLKSVLTDKTKAIIVSFPNNPTGATMTYQDYEKLVPILEEYEGIVISDEIYSELNYAHEHASLAMFDSIKHKVVVINGFSKAYAMTGWRLGYVCGDASIIEPMVTIHQYSIMCSPTISQYAAIEALKHGDSSIQDMKQQYLLRQTYLIKRFEAMGLSVFKPSGTFYLYVDITSTNISSAEFCEQLLHQYHVAVIPATAFGSSSEGFIRVSYSYQLDHLAIACDKIEAFVQELLSK